MLEVEPRSFRLGHTHVVTGHAPLLRPRPFAEATPNSFRPCCFVEATPPCSQTTPLWRGHTLIFTGHTHLGHTSFTITSGHSRCQVGRPRPFQPRPYHRRTFSLHLKTKNGVPLFRPHPHDQTTPTHSGPRPLSKRKAHPHPCGHKRRGLTLPIIWPHPFRRHHPSSAPPAATPT